MNNRFYAFVAAMKHPPQVRHMLGMPPELVGGEDYRDQLPWPNILVIDERNDGVFLFRYAKNGDCGGDTWHMTVEQAKEQAEYEYGDAVGEWRGIPKEVEDALTFVLSQLQ